MRLPRAVCPTDYLGRRHRAGRSSARLPADFRTHKLRDLSNAGTLHPCDTTSHPRRPTPDTDTHSASGGPRLNRAPSLAPTARSGERKAVGTRVDRTLATSARSGSATLARKSQHTLGRRPSSFLPLARRLICFVSSAVPRPRVNDSLRTGGKRKSRKTNAQRTTN